MLSRGRSNVGSAQTNDLRARAHVSRVVDQSGRWRSTGTSHPGMSACADRCSCLCTPQSEVLARLNACAPSVLFGERLPSFYGGCRTCQHKLSDRSNELSIKRDRGNDRIELGEQIGLVLPQVLLHRFVLEKFRQVALCKH
jgi:hypothetical protein